MIVSNVSPKLSLLSNLTDVSFTVGEYNLSLLNNIQLVNLLISISKSLALEFIIPDIFIQASSPNKLESWIYKVLVSFTK